MQRAAHLTTPGVPNLIEVLPFEGLEFLAVVQMCAVNMILLCSCLAAPRVSGCNQHEEISSLLGFHSISMGQIRVEVHWGHWDGGFYKICKEIVRSVLCAGSFSNLLRKLSDLC